jgi:hypothetical protein
MLGTENMKAFILEPQTEYCPIKYLTSYQDFKNLWKDKADYHWSIARKNIL